MTAPSTSSNPFSISAVVLTLNEEKTIARALSSLHWCDQLIVVDSGSTDDTLRIARSCGATVLQHKQPPPFQITDQRNWALNHPVLKSDWVLFLDADEVVTPMLQLEIKSVLSSRPVANGYLMAPRYLFLGKWLKFTQGYPSWHPRLLRRGYLDFEGGVWESFSSTDKIYKIHQPYDHHAFDKGLDDWVIKHLRYSSWDADEAFNYLTNSQKRTSTRYRDLRHTMDSLWPLRPFLRFIQKYILQLGFLDGWQGLIYSLLICTYDIFVITRIASRYCESRCQK